MINHNNSQLENHLNYIKKKRVKFYFNYQIENEVKAQEKNEKSYPFLDLKSEERVQDFKNHIIKLEHQVEKNYENAKYFLENKAKNQNSKSLFTNSFEPQIFQRKQ